MKAAFQISIFLFTVPLVVGGEPTKDENENPWKLITSVSGRPWPGPAYPEVPSIPQNILMQSGHELNEDVRDALRKLNPERPDSDAQSGIQLLEKQKAIWTLQVALCHPKRGIQVASIQALGRLKAVEAVPFLIMYGYYVDTGTTESDGYPASMRDEALAQTLSTITGIRHRLNEPGPHVWDLAVALRDWTRWYLDHTEKEFSETRQRIIDALKEK